VAGDGEQARMRGAKVVEVFRTLHLALGPWYWFLFATLTLITLHTFDHTAAVFTDRSPFAESFISDENTEGFILWHGGLTVADYTMTIVLLTFLFRRSFPPATGAGQSVHGLSKARFVFSRLHQIMGKWYWFLWGALIPISFHTGDHVIAIFLNTSPLSDTIVANSISHEGFLIWHSSLTILDYMLTVMLLWMIYLQWTVSHRAPVGLQSPASASVAAETE
jgi:hypothetical protein